MTNKMLLLLIICTNILLTYTAQSQFHFDFVRFLPTVFNSLVPAREVYFSKSADDKIYYFSTNNFDRNKKRLKLYYTDIRNLKQDSIMLQLPKDSVYMSFSDIAVSENYIAILNYNSIFVFNRKTNLLVYSKIDEDFDYMKIKNFIGTDEFLLFKDYYHHPADGIPLLKLQTLLFRNNKLTKSNIGTFDYKGLQYSIRVNNWVEVSSQYIYIANVLDFKISVLYKNLNLAYTIDMPRTTTDSVINNLLWQQNKTRLSQYYLLDSLKKNTHDKTLLYQKIRNCIDTMLVPQAKDIYDTLLRYDDKIWRIEKIFVNESDDIWISISCPSCKFDKRHITYKKRNQKWEKEYIMNNKIDDTLYQVSDFYKMNYTYTSKMIYTNNYFISYTNKTYLPKVKFPISSKYFQDSLNNYYTDNDGNSGFVIYKHNDY